MLFKLANDWSADRCWPTWFDHLYLISFFFFVVVVFFFFLFEWDWWRWFDHWELSNNGNNRRKWWCLSVFIILRFTYFCLFTLSRSLSSTSISCINYNIKNRRFPPDLMENKFFASFSSSLHLLLSCFYADLNGMKSSFSPRSRSLSLSAFCCYMYVCMCIAGLHKQENLYQAFPVITYTSTI